MKIKRILKVDVSEDCYFNPDAAEIVITMEFIERVLQLRKAIMELKVYKIAEFDYTPKYLTEDGNNNYKSWDGRMDTVMLNVTEESIYWSSYIKNTSARTETLSIKLSELLEIRKVLKASKEELPLMINSLDNGSSIDALHQRLSE